MTLSDDIGSTLSAAVESDDGNLICTAAMTYGLTGCDLGEWLTLASSLGCLNAMNALLKFNADVLWQNENGETAFSFACAYDQLEAARLLHRHGAYINSVDASGGTPLDWAVCHARPEFREWLKSIGGTRNTDHEEWPWPPQNGE